MYCINCGASLAQGSRFCRACGAEQDHGAAAGTNLIGFSTRIGDPAFAKYIKNSNNWAIMFTVALALVAIIGFYVAGERGIDNMSNPQALYIGLGVGGMFITIAVFQIVGRSRSKTWDGIVEDKTSKEKTEQQSYGDGESRLTSYIEYTVIIRSSDGKRHLLRSRDDTLYNYYRVGDRVRYHAGLNSYEKYDKSGDTFIPCNACASLCDIRDDYCFRCKCPLLK